jgi:hypothetical protein
MLPLGVGIIYFLLKLKEQELKSQIYLRCHFSCFQTMLGLFPSLVKKTQFSKTNKLYFVGGHRFSLNCYKKKSTISCSQGLRIWPLYTVLHTVHLHNKAQNLLAVLY